MIIYPKIDNRLLKTYPASQRQSKVSESFEAKPLNPGSSFSDFLESLAPVLKVDDFKAVARAVVSAKEKRKPVIVMLGGHVIKTGCSRILINLAEQGFISHFASNGSAAIHDVELARFGHTSEDVVSQIEDGSFGMAHDTAAFVNDAAINAAETEYGFGQIIGNMLIEEKSPYLERSLLASCERLSIPYTLHVGIGTDIVHQHPSADGGAIGKASLRDFHILCASVAKLGNGGIVLNLGSAVVMPEVFLKCLAVARNLHPDVHNFTTANFDMIQHYRPTVNVVNRPNSKGGKGFAITGHHEIMLPLFAATVQEYASIR
jgi:hypothetical protein